MARTPAPAPRRAAVQPASVKQVEMFMTQMLPEEIAQPLLTLMGNLIELHTVANEGAVQEQPEAEQEAPEDEQEAPQEEAPRRRRAPAPQPAPARGRRAPVADPDEQDEAPADDNEEAPDDDEGLLGDGDLLTPEEQDEAPQEEPAPRRRGPGGRAAPAPQPAPARGRRAAPEPQPEAEAEGITFDNLFTRKELAGTVESYATQYANDYKAKAIKEDIATFSTEQLGEDNVIALRGADVNTLADSAARVYAGIEKLMGMAYADLTALLADYELTPQFARNQSEKTRRKIAVATLINACLENA